MTEKPRAVCYLRVSTHMQERDGVSLDAQLDLARRFCDLRGFDLLETYVDTMTGTSDARPGLAKLEADLKRRAFDHVLVYKIDRLSRDTAHYHKLLQDFDRHGVGLGSLTQPIDATSSIGKVIMALLISLAEYESEQTAERVRDSIRYRAQQGRIIAGQCAPLGYCYTKAYTDAEGRRHAGRYEVDEEEAPTVRFLFDTYLERRSMLATTRAANEAGMLGRNGKKITLTVLRALLANPIYKGELATCRVRTVKVGGRKVRIKVKPDNWIRREGVAPALVDAMTWESAQDLIAINSAKPPAAIAGRNRFAWSGLVRCGWCGQSMRHAWMDYKLAHCEKRYGRYLCRARDERGLDRCSRGLVSESFLDHFVAPAVFEAAREAMKKTLRVHKTRPVLKAPVIIADELSKLDKRRRRLRDLYELGDMPLDEYKGKMAEVNRRIAEAQARQAQPATTIAPPLPSLPDDLQNAWTRLDAYPDKRNRMLSALVENVTIMPDKVARIAFRPYDHPTWPTSLDVPIVHMQSREGRKRRQQAAR